MTTSPLPLPRRRQPALLAPAFVVTVSVIAVASACSDPQANDGLGSTAPIGERGGAAGASTPPSGGAAQAGGAAGASLGGAGQPSGVGGAEAGAGKGGVGGSLGGKGGGPAGSSGKGGSTNEGGSAGAAGTGAGSAGSGGIVNSIDCPANARMNDPCEHESLVCSYSGYAYCQSVATCTAGRWRVKLGSKPGGSCNPPPPCPEDEPADVENGSCQVGGFGGPSHCRYARQGCFTYLTCGGGGATGHWRPTIASASSQSTCDSCCPIEPPTLGEACVEAELLCPGADGDVICHDGKWSARAPLPGAAGSGGGGAGGASGEGGSGNPGGLGGGFGSGGEWAGGAPQGGMGGAPGPRPGCPEQAPQMNDPCADGLACKYVSGCQETASTCTNARWKNVHASPEGCGVLPECPDEEPTDAAHATCAPFTGLVSQGQCRYPHGSCFRYLECGPDEMPRWKAPDYRPLDSCCPEKQPALASPCDDDGAVCSWRSLCDPFAKPAPLVCLGGTWQAPPP